jgi:hypothetical protein
MLESDLENSLTESEYINFMSKNLLEKKWRILTKILFRIRKII